MQFLLFAETYVFTNEVAIGNRMQIAGRNHVIRGVYGHALIVRRNFGGVKAWLASLSLSASVVPTKTSKSKDTRERILPNRDSRTLQAARMRVLKQVEGAIKSDHGIELRMRNVYLRSEVTHDQGGKSFAEPRLLALMRRPGSRLREASGSTMRNKHIHQYGAVASTSDGYQS